MKGFFFIVFLSIACYLAPRSDAALKNDDVSPQGQLRLYGAASTQIRLSTMTTTVLYSCVLELSTVATCKESKRRRRRRSQAMKHLDEKAINDMDSEELGSSQNPEVAVGNGEKEGRIFIALTTFTTLTSTATATNTATTVSVSYLCAPPGEDIALC